MGRVGPGTFGRPGGKSGPPRRNGHQRTGEHPLRVLLFPRGAAEDFGRSPGRPRRRTENPRRSGRGGEPGDPQERHLRSRTSCLRPRPDGSPHGNGSSPFDPCHRRLLRRGKTPFRRNGEHRIRKPDGHPAEDSRRRCGKGPPRPLRPIRRRPFPRGGETPGGNPGLPHGRRGRRNGQDRHQGADRFPHDGGPVEGRHHPGAGQRRPYGPPVRHRRHRERQLGEGRFRSCGGRHPGADRGTGEGPGKRPVLPELRPGIREGRSVLHSSRPRDQGSLPYPV